MSFYRWFVFSHDSEKSQRWPSGSWESWTWDEVRSMNVWAGTWQSALFLPFLYPFIFRHHIDQWNGSQQHNIHMEAQGTLEWGIRWAIRDLTSQQLIRSRRWWTECLLFKGAIGAKIVTNSYSVAGVVLGTLIFLYSRQQPQELGDVILPVMVRKHRHREVKWFAWSHTARENVGAKDSMPATPSSETKACKLSSVLPLLSQMKGLDLHTDTKTLQCFESGDVIWRQMSKERVWPILPRKQEVQKWVLQEQWSWIFKD